MFCQSVQCGEQLGGVYRFDNVKIEIFKTPKVVLCSDKRCPCHFHSSDHIFQYSKLTDCGSRALGFWQLLLSGEMVHNASVDSGIDICGYVVQDLEFGGSNPSLSYRSRKCN